ncbi:hypothetical protein GH714_021150 [Hevea brasiliensis]|uniref:DUF4219 domain-containing protein n=1 Tax=Hevea brasiliensis TaxID=3981 RepID=A0A6A6K6P3_HEVBR|nr:hypothetical protein GH714_021150 [Hevea brasiliensis]
MSHLEIERARREREQRERELKEREDAASDASNRESVSSQEKEGSVTLKYPMLTKSNYAAWAIKMEVFMMAQGVWEPIESEGPVDNRKDKMALAAIYQGIGEDTLLQLGAKKTAKEAWNMLKIMNQGAEKVKEIVSAIEEFSDLKTKSVEEVIGSLKAHEERLLGCGGNSAETVLLTRAEWKAREEGSSSKKAQNNNSGRGGRGRGRGCGRGRGRSNGDLRRSGDDESKPQKKKTKAKSGVIVAAKWDIMLQNVPQKRDEKAN